MIIIIICVVLLIALGIFIYKNETFAGAMVQMYAKGPEDHYLTTDTDQYIPPYFYGSNWFWNAPTRLSRPYYPLYGIYPNYYYGYPYSRYW